MAATAAEEGYGDLSPDVRDLVTAVRERVKTATSPEEIRRLADEAIEIAQGNVRTLREIRQLAEVALDASERISVLMKQLAALTGTRAELG